MKKYLRVKDLIEILKQYNPECPVVVTDEGKNHQYGVKKEDVFLKNGAYFANDIDAEEAYEMYWNEEGDFVCDLEFLNIGCV